MWYVVHSKDRSEPNRTEPNRTEPNWTGSGRFDPKQSDPDRTGPDQSGPDRTGPDQSGFEPNRSELIFCYNTLGLYITNNNQESQVEGKTKRVSFFSLSTFSYIP